jgi:dTDP-glucose pyrophosphorylase
MIDFSDHLIAGDQSILEAIKRLEALNRKESMTLFVYNGTGEVLGSVSDGDIRRGLIHGYQLQEPVSKVMNRDFHALTSNGYDIQEIDEIKNKGIQLIPILDQENRMIRLIDLKKHRSLLPVDAVIMAGGKGRRLRPLTDQLPKPLLRVGSKPIMEHNIDRLVSFGVSNIHVTINYLAEKIVEYFGDGQQKGAKILYTKEPEPMGTLGAVSLIDDFEHDSVLVMNSDLLTDINFEDFYKDYRKKEADIAIVSIPYEVKIPYAVLELDGHRITTLAEKPTYTYFSNGGIYLVRKELLQAVPKDQFYDATDLIEQAINDGHTVVNYPIRSYWLDIGRPEDYQKAQEDINHIQL